ncbi:RNA polymerase sigma factor [Dysgonomonas sp.]
MSNEYDINIRDLCLLKQGNENGFRSIFRKYNAKVYHFALNMLHDENLAEDITQDVFLTVWKCRADIDLRKNFQAYLYTIAKNRVYRETEKKVLALRYENHIRNEHLNEDSTTEEIIDTESMKKLILQLIEKQPKIRKKIFLLRFIEGLSNKDIAARLSISEGNVAQQIQRSIKFIKSHLNIFLALLLLQ